MHTRTSISYMRTRTYNIHELTTHFYTTIGRILPHYTICLHELATHFYKNHTHNSATLYHMPPARSLPAASMSTAHSITPHSCYALSPNTKHIFCRSTYSAALHILPLYIFCPSTYSAALHILPVYIFCPSTYFQPDLRLQPPWALHIVLPCVHFIFCHPLYAHYILYYPTFILCSVTLHTTYILPPYIFPARSLLHGPFLPPCTHSMLCHRMHTFNVPSPYIHHTFCHPTFSEIFAT